VRGFEFIRAAPHSTAPATHITIFLEKQQERGPPFPAAVKTGTRLQVLATAPAGPGRIDPVKHELTFLVCSFGWRSIFGHKLYFYYRVKMNQLTLKSDRQQARR